MYFWNIGSLKGLILGKGLTEAQVFYYVLLYVALTALGMEVMGYLPYEDPNEWDRLQSLLNISIPVVGTLVAYWVNGGAAGSAFAAKYFSIGFVTAMRFLIYLVPVIAILVAYYFWSATDDDETVPTGRFEVAIFTA